MDSFINLFSRAKENLKGKYWISFAVCLIFIVINRVLSLPSDVVNLLINEKKLERIGMLLENLNIDNSFLYNYHDHFKENLYIITMFVFMFAIIFLLVRSFIAFGNTKYYINLSKGKAEFGDIVSIFKEPAGKRIGGIIMQYIFIVLWSLLFAIPGLIALFRYYMVLYILTENPNISWRRAFEISKKTTKGYKGKMFAIFVIEVLVSIFTFGFLQPYFNSINVEIYIDLKKIALEKGIATPEDFGEQTILAEQSIPTDM